LYDNGNGDGKSLQKYLGPGLYDSVIVRDEKNGCFNAFASISDATVYKDGIPDEDRCLHEVIFGRNPQRIKFDIDAPKSMMDELSEDDIPDIYLEAHDKKHNAMINYLADKILTIFISSYGEQLPYIPTRQNNIVITEAHGKTKFSFHIIVTKFSVPNNDEAKWFTEKVTLAIPQDITNMIDMQVNKGTQNFRMLGCTKTTGYRPKRISLINDSAFDDCFIQQPTDVVLKSKHKNIFNTPVTSGQKLAPEVIDKIKYVMDAQFPAFKFRDVKDEMIRFDRTYASHCDICDRYHDNDNTLLAFVKGGTLYRKCRHNKDDIRAVATVEESKVNRIDVLTSIVDRELNEDAFDSMARYEDFSTIYDAPYVDTIPDASTVCLRAPMKLGKTKALKEYTDALDPDLSICILSFRIAFSKHVASTFKDFVLYKGISGDIKPKQHKRVIVQVESFHRIRGVYDIIVLDESESIFAQFGSGNVKNKAIAVANFQRNIKDAKRVICMDAFMGDRTIELIRRMRKGLISIVINKHKNACDYVYKLGYSETFMIRDILDAIDRGENIVIVSNSKMKLKCTHELIRREHPTIPMEIYTADTDAAKRNAHMERVNECWVNYRVILYSPTITAGVSFEQKHFDQIYAIFTNKSCDALTCMQMLGRIRNVGKQTISICFNTSLVRCPTTIEGIEYDIIRGRTEGLSSIDHFTLTINDDYQYVPVKNTPYYLWVYNELTRNRSRRSFERCMCQYIAQTGAHMEVFDGEIIPEVEALIKISRDAVIADRAHAVAVADDIDICDMQMLHDKVDEGIDLSTDEHLQLHKYKLAQFYGIPPRGIDTEFVLKYDKDDAKRVYSNLRDILQCATMIESVDILRDIEQKRYHRIKDNEVMEIGYVFTSVDHLHACRVLDLAGFEHLLDDKHVRNTIMFDNLQRNTQKLNDICRHFRRPNPIPRDVNISIEDAMFKAQFKTINAILNYMYGCVMARAGDEYKIKQKHNFFVATCDDDLELRDPNSTMPLVKHNFK
jgi:hypothetical protein